MKQNMTRREFIKTAAMSALAFSAAGLLTPEKLFAAEGDLSVKTRYGTFRGFLDEKGVKTWLGIPYAKPPVKNCAGRIRRSRTLLTRPLTRRNSARRLCRK